MSAFANRHQVDVRGTQAGTRCERSLPQQVARIEPMLSPRRCENFWEGTSKLGIFRAAVVPQRAPVRCFSETENLFHSTVAVGRDHQDRTRKSHLTCVYPNYRVVMELALLPMIEKLVGTATNAPDLIKNTAERETIELLHVHPESVPSIWLRGTVGVPPNEAGVQLQIPLRALPAV